MQVRPSSHSLYHYQPVTRGWAKEPPTAAPLKPEEIAEIRQHFAFACSFWFGRLHNTTKETGQETTGDDRGKGVDPRTSAM